MSRPQPGEGAFARPEYCLGIEGSANKLGVGIVRGDGTILANVRDTYNARPGEGFVPADAMRHHQEHMVPLLRRAFREAGIGPKELTHVAYTRGPGIGSCLSVASACARMLAAYLGVPLIPVNHCIAHVEMGRHITGIDNPTVLYASGGNTQVLAYCPRSEGHGTYSIFGETLDIAVGNCIDRVARCLRLETDPSPGYHVMCHAARYRARHTVDGVYTPPPLCEDIPYCVKGMDVSCTGVEGYVKQLVAQAGRRGEQVDVERVCFSVEEVLFAMLTEVTERAAAYIGSKDVLVVGGVGCNERLQEMLGAMAADRGGRLVGMDDRFAVDNGAMIAYTGLLMVHSGAHAVPPDAVDTADVTQCFRSDEVDVTWRN